MTSSKSSDYGDIFLDLCDSNLRKNVVQTLVKARTGDEIIPHERVF